jgi:predicted amidohydrolase
LGIRIALGQASTSEVKADNLRKGLKMIKEASEKGADLLILPELFMAYRQLSESRDKFTSVAERLDGPFVTTLSKEARRRKLHVAVGVLERSEQRGLVHNTVVMIGPDGSLLSKHRKAQLFDSFGYIESSRIAPGSEFEGAFNASLGRMGMMTCYELRFPELARILTLQGARLIVVPTAWVAGRAKEDHLRVFARARALENTVFLAVACQTGRIFTGRSVVVDPFGIPVCDAGEEEGVFLTEVDPKRIDRVRETLPVLKHLRTDIYSRFWKQK